MQYFVFRFGRDSLLSSPESAAASIDMDRRSFSCAALRVVHYKSVQYIVHVFVSEFKRHRHRHRGRRGDERKRDSDSVGMK